ncbi:MAG: hypothetical protein IJ524_02685 [Bacteroidales bacterium]|nr:hypothetical protein [Bacteroidales bacterium]
MKHSLLTLTLLLIACPVLRAQVGDTTGWHMRLSTGASVSSGFGQTQSLSWVAPSFEFHPTSRLTVNTGFAAVGSLMPSDYKLQGNNARSLAPLRAGTQATALWAEASYRINQRLWVWGAVAHVGGFAQPLWLDRSLPLQATAFSGGFGYRFGENSILEMHIHIVRDKYGTLAPMLYDDPFHYNRLLF